MFIVKFIFLVQTMLFANSFEDSLNQEKNFLLRQQSSLKLQNNKILQDSKKAQTQLQNEILAAQKKLMAVQDQIKSQQEKLTELKETFDSKSKTSDQIQSVWASFAKNISQLTQLQFFLPENEMPSLSVQSFSDKVKLVNQGFDLLMSSTQTYEFKGHYLFDGEIQNGKIKRFEGVEKGILAPSTDKIPEVKLSAKELLGDVGFFIFNRLEKSQVPQIEANFMDRIYHSLPAVFLILVFSIVLGLFGFFIKE